MSAAEGSQADVVSFAPDLTSEWRTRPINLFSVLKSFVYQLSPGQDLTRVSLPTELCYPFSALEFMAVRILECFHGLFDINNVTDPKERFLVATRWYLSMLREGEAAHTTRKPFNPVIGEVHHAFVDYTDPANAGVLPDSVKVKENPSDKTAGWTTFVGEQVSHHPPVMAFVIENRLRGLRLDCSAAFAVRPPLNFHISSFPFNFIYICNFVRRDWAALVPSFGAVLNFLPPVDVAISPKLSHTFLSPPFFERDSYCIPSMILLDILMFLGQIRL